MRRIFPNIEAIVQWLIVNSIPFSEISSDTNLLFSSDHKPHKTAYTPSEKRFHITNYLKGKETIVQHAISHKIPYSSFRDWVAQKEKILQSNPKFSLARTRMRESHKSQ